MQKKTETTRWDEMRQLFFEDCNHATAISRDNLKELLEKNQDTEYGKRFQFSKIHSIAQYQEMAPITEYQDYQPYVERMQQGEERLLTVYPVKHYIMTSGSTGTPKRIPLTTEALSRCVDPIYYTCFSAIPDIEKGKILHLSVFRMEPPEKKENTILSAAYFRELYDRGTYELDSRYLGGTGLLFSEQIGTVPYVKLWIALSSPEMRGIQAFFLYDILVFFRYFENHWETVLRDIRNREISDQAGINGDIQKLLLGLPAPSREWLDKVEMECQKGFAGIAKRLWKDCRWASGVGGGNFRVQEEALRRYLGEIPLHYFSYAASECMLAITTEMESTRNVLLPRSGFFEFLPWGEDEAQTTPKTIDQLEIGKQYELILTNFSGFYRYRLNDVVKVAGFCGEAPILEICFRKNQAINIAGEKMDMQTLSMAGERLAEACGFLLTECSWYADSNSIPGRYLCFYEVDGETEEAGNMDELLDIQLKKSNEDYEDLRNLGLIAPAKAIRVERGTHEACKQQFQSANRQNKPLQLLTDHRFVDFMMEHVK